MVSRAVLPPRGTVAKNRHVVRITDMRCLSPVASVDSSNCISIPEHINRPRMGSSLSLARVGPFLSNLIQVIRIRHERKRSAFAPWHNRTEHLSKYPLHTDRSGDRCDGRGKKRKKRDMGTTAKPSGRPPVPPMSRASESPAIFNHVPSHLAPRPSVPLSQVRVAGSGTRLCTGTLSTRLLLCPLIHVLLYVLTSLSAQLRL